MKQNTPAANDAHCKSEHHCDAHPASHQHGADCGHKAVSHQGHSDYLVDGHLHHAHNGHCDSHGKHKA